MCRMVGAVFTEEFPVGTLEDLRKVAEVGVIPGEREVGHRDGWGLVSFANGGPKYLARSPESICTDPLFGSALSRASALSGPDIIIAHARAASRGGRRLENTHPFIVDGVVLAHNGTVNGLKPPRCAAPKGESDSELLALLLADLYADEKDLGRALESLVTEEISKTTFTGAVLLASDGRKLCGYRDYAREDRASYYDLRIAREGDSVVFFQESVMARRGEVSQVSKGELVEVSLDLSVRRRRVG